MPYPLIAAAKRGDKSKVRELIASGVDLNAKEKQEIGFAFPASLTALQVAVHEGHGEIAKMLIDAGSDVRAKDEYGQTALHIACRYDFESIVNDLIVARADVDPKDLQGQTPLHLACRDACLIATSSVARLIKAGANVNAINSDGNTPLHVASSYGNVSIVSDLILAGADIHRTNTDGWTALHKACDARNSIASDVVHALLKAGAIRNARTNDGKTALDIAKKKNERGVVMLLENDFYTRIEAISSIVANAVNEKKAHFRTGGSVYFLLLKLETDLFPSRRGKCFLSTDLADLLLEPLEDMFDLFQLQIYYTTVNAYYRMLLITERERSRLISRALEKAATFRHDERTHEMFEGVLEHAVNQSIISRNKRNTLSANATITRFLQSDTMKYIMNMIQENRTAILENRRAICQIKNELDDFREATSSAVLELDQKIKRLNIDLHSVHNDVGRVNESLNKLRGGILFQQRVQAVGNLISAVLNALTIGAAGSAVEGVLALSISSIVDFGDAAHIVEALESADTTSLDYIGEMTLGETVQTCTDLAVGTLSDSKLKKALDSKNTVVVVAGAAAVFKNLQFSAEAGSKKYEEKPSSISAHTVNPFPDVSMVSKAPHETSRDDTYVPDDPPADVLSSVRIFGIWRGHLPCLLSSNIAALFIFCFFTSVFLMHPFFFDLEATKQY